MIRWKSIADDGLDIHGVYCNTVSEALLFFIWPVPLRRIKISKKLYVFKTQYLSGTESVKGLE